MIKTKMDLLAIRHSRIIEDPFPELSAQSRHMDMHNDLCGWFGLLKKKLDRSDCPSPWKAYRLGYEKAYAEIESALNEGEET